MALVDEALYTRLAGYGPLTALVATRIYPIRAVQNAPTPYVNYQKVSGPRLESFAGPTGLASPRFQIDAWSPAAFEAKRVAEEIRHALDGFRGRLADVAVEGIILLDERDLFDPEALYVGVSQDFRIWHREN